ncbi:DUF799 domain-containing protein [Aquitalea aquatica]|uniref:DUF799 domain-containing protein n=1 Tax=Aquitalea aquatica TaxID=3044273 RepID=A0A838Y715_9NEIS|nr:DUF799 domain-containing protein [Aquitalea magnusonii]MBA4708359.1 DUF799 domain-containing protein [Aquitalea magnusonii]
MRNTFRLMICLVAAALLSACASQPPAKRDYTAYKQSNPKTILVLPPLNNSPDVNASYSVLSQLSYPLAESGYYVLPVALVDATFKQNGLTVAGDIHQVAPAKLREIFGADAALFVTVSKYGSTYTVLDSVTVVTASARLVDLRSGTELWSGSASASSAENQNNNSGGGLVGMLISAAIRQVANNLSDSGHDVAGMTSQRLLSAGYPNGLLFGPHSPRYGTD